MDSHWGRGRTPYTLRRGIVTGVAQLKSPVGASYRAPGWMMDSQRGRGRTPLHPTPRDRYRCCPIEIHRRGVLQGARWMMDSQRGRGRTPLHPTPRDHYRCYPIEIPRRGVLQGARWMMDSQRGRGSHIDVKIRASSVREGLQTLPYERFGWQF